MEGKFMFVNLLSFLVMILLVILFGWLTWRAIRAKHLWVKIVGGLFAGLLTLVFAAVTFMAGKGMVTAYRAPVPAPDLTVVGTPEQIARGKYLASIACVGCHGADGQGEFPLSGGLDLSGEFPVPGGPIVAANITPGGVLADRTDGELFRVIRHGFGKGIRGGFMSFLPYRELSDEDTQAIIAFLRSQEPVTTASNGGDKPNLLGVIIFYGTGILPLPEGTDGVITAPPPGDTAEYGKYVATYGECRGCHGPDMTGAAATSITPAYPNPRPIVATWTLDQFIQTMRTGLRPGGAELKMPWKNASMMSDADLAALYTYLKTTP
jgi:mono/diheme cytochrome c family protein